MNRHLLSLTVVKQLKVDLSDNNIIWSRNAEDEQKIKLAVDDILLYPLTLKDAVKIALINNPHLQQSYTNIGIAQSDLIQAGLFTNPLLGYSIGRGSGASVNALSIEFSFLDLLWIPIRKQLSGLALQQVQLEVGDEVLKTVKDVKTSYINLIASEQKVNEFESILKSSEISSQLAARQYAAGNLSKRNYLRIHESYMQDHLKMMELNRLKTVTKENFCRLLGLHGTQTKFILPKNYTLDSLQSVDHTNVEFLAVMNRLDVAAVRKQVEHDAAQAGYVLDTRLLSEGIMEFDRQSASNESSALKNFGIKMSLPIFDYGQGRVELSKALYLKSLHRLYEVTVNAKSQAREAYARVRYAQDAMQEQQEQILPLKLQILEETQKNYNGMLDGIDILLTDQKELVQAKMDMIDKTVQFENDYFDLEYTLGGFNVNR